MVGKGDNFWQIGEMFLIVQQNAKTPALMNHHMVHNININATSLNFIAKKKLVFRISVMRESS